MFTLHKERNVSNGGCLRHTQKSRIWPGFHFKVLYADWQRVKKWSPENVPIRGLLDSFGTWRMSGCFFLDGSNNRLQTFSPDAHAAPRAQSFQRLATYFLQTQRNACAQSGSIRMRCQLRRPRPQTSNIARVASKWMANLARNVFEMRHKDTHVYIKKKKKKTKRKRYFI